MSHPLIVHSHLNWDWVWQRPQQFLSRLSRGRRVLFCEGPRLFEGEGEPYSRLYQPPEWANLWVLQTFLPAAKFDESDWVDAARLRILQETICGSLCGLFERPIQWFYDPMAFPAFSEKIGEVATVYDCMDELAAFKFAARELVERERALLKHADLVFAGGRRMAQSKARFNENVHFYGCGVDVEHFGKARQNNTPIPADIATLKSPILGYFGVVDERLDYELLATLAEDDLGHIAIVGPTCKIAPAELPQHANLHWLGGRDYTDLPAYCRAFDVCLMPFARNEATEYINPTKALEYMATARPIVASDVPDVVANFGEVVKIARNHEEFLAHCRAAISEPDQSAIERGLRLAGENTWEMIVEKLEYHLAALQTTEVGS